MDNSISLEIHDMTVMYQRKRVLWDIDIVIPNGKLVAIVGPNGAGKTTLIRAVLGLVPLASGWVKIFGKSYQEVRKEIGYVPQRESVDWDFPATALDVVLMGTYGRLGWIKRPGKLEKQIANDALAKVGLAELKDRQIGALSGGQQQRVFLARALAQQAKLYFMDEPFAAVDATTEKSIIEILKSLRSEGKTVIVVHHDLHTIREYFEWVILINQRLIACGPVQEVFTSENLQKTYGGKLTLLTDVTEAMAQEKLKPL
ncbi:MAG: metal ABC transporter ATP-binding protein [bacterium]|nr:metal ABC transporter ATP-binding protein [bacterium]